MKRNRDGLRHNSNNEDENDNNTVWKDKGGEIGDAPLLVVTKANLLKMDGLLRSTLTVEEVHSIHTVYVFVRVIICHLN